MEEEKQEDEEVILTLDIEHMSSPHITKVSYGDGDGDGPTRENQSVWLETHFHQQLNRILSDSKNKIKAEANTMVSHFTSNMSFAIQKEKECHAVEKAQLCREIDGLHQCVHSLEAIIDIRRNNIEVLIEKFQQGCNLVLISKAFYSWKLFTDNRKRERFLESMATRHYETNLKQKAFSWWLAQLNRNWKNKMELKAHVEMLEVQRRIVDAYEARIRSLEDNLSEAGKKISTLQTRHKVHTDSLNKPFSLTQNPLVFNLSNASTDPLFRRTGVIPEKPPPLRIDGNAVFCSDCTVQGNYIQQPAKCYNCSTPESTSCSIHSNRDVDPTAEQPNISTWPQSSHHLCHSLPRDKVHITRPDKWIESHVPYIQPSVESRYSRPNSSKSTKLKKTV